MLRLKMTRGMVGILAAIGVSSFATPALAGDIEACLSAADQAQQLRDDGKFRTAREQLLTCARDVCPAPVKRDCGDWLTQLDATAPSVVLTAKEGSTDLTDVTVAMDGTPLTEKLDGRPILMDLGTHTFTFTYQGQEKSESVLFSAGQKMRTVSVQFGASSGSGDGTGDSAGDPEEPGPAEGSSKRSVLPYVLGGVGVAALGSFAFFGLSGNSQRSDLEKSCQPNCTDDQVSPVRTKHLIADISLAAGIVSLGVATYLLLKPSAPSAKAAQEPVARVRFDFGPVKGGAAGGISGTF